MDSNLPWITSLLVLAVAFNVTAFVTEVNYNLLENTGPGYSVGNLQTNAASSGGSEYKFANGSNCTKYFSLFSSGEIQTKINIDREYFIETTDKDTITCVGEYKGGTSNGAAGTKLSLIVTISIKDVNDVVPKFFGLQQPIDNRTVYENLRKGSIVLYLMPYDLDNGANGTVNFTIIEGNEEDYFKLRPPVSGDNSPDRVLYLNKDLDYEQIPVFNLTFKITDHGETPLVSYQYLLIHLIDVNDEDPAFPVSQFYFDVPEDHPVGRDHPFGRVNATDQDSATHAEIFYLLVGSSDVFEVNITTGELYLLQSLDYDAGAPTLSFSVDARNPGMKTGTNAEIEVTVLDVNDEVPKLIQITPTAIFENETSFDITAIYQDSDMESPNNQIVNASVSFSSPVEYQIFLLGGGPLYFIRIIANYTLDREKTPVLNATIFVTDNGLSPLTSITTVSIEIIDANDNAPQFTQEKFLGKVLEVSEPERYVLTVTAIDPDYKENAEFEFMISEVTPPIAQDWFTIDSITGDIYLVKKPSYSSVEGQVDINVTARDHAGNSNWTVVEISVIPPITFEPNSFQEYSNINLVGSSTVYIEFRTDRSNSSLLLLYQRSIDQQSPLLEAYLQLIENKMVYSNGSNEIEKTFDFQSNKWYSVLIETMDNIQVWEKGTDVNSEAVWLLQTTTINQCSEQTTSFEPASSVVTPLSVGGVDNIFDIPIGVDNLKVKGYDFNGQISTVIIGDHQLDMSCPLRQRRAISGNHFTGHLCTSFTDSCNPSYSSCVSYVAEESGLCQCKSGFPSDSCDQDEDYNPISIANGTHVKFILDYDYFFSANQQPYLSYASDSNIAQTVTISFTSATDSLAGVLFYSKTKHSINVLEIDETIRYTVRDTNYAILWNRVSEEVTITSGTQYTVVMQILSNDELISLSFGETNKEMKQLGLSRPITSTLNLPYKFAEQPMTTVSIGGLTDAKFPVISQTFRGCVTHFSIDGVPIPINNFIRTGYLDTTIVGNTDDLSLTCHACYNQSKCSSNHVCTMIGTLSEERYNCKCSANNPECVQPTTVTATVPATSIQPTETGGGRVTEGVENPGSTDKLGLNMIIGVSAGSLFMVVLIIVLLTLIVRCAYVKGKKKRSFKFVTQVTYHQKDDSPTEQDMESIPSSRHVHNNNYIDTPIKHTHCPSTDDSAIDGVIHSPLSLRESTSQETGFHTASEFDPPSRQSSPRRAYDSGKSSSEQYDSDIETDSESLNTSGIEECQSPHVLHMVKGGGIPPLMNGNVPPYLRKKHGLSSKEILALTPLHPNSATLLMEDETGSEISTTTNTTNRHYDDESIISDSNGPKWYKSSSPSTIVSNDGNPLPHTVPSQHYHYHSHTLDSYKRSKRKLPPGTFRPHKSNSPPHYYVNHNGHSPLSTSPLVQKAHRFEYPPYSPASVSSRGSHNSHYENVDPSPCIHPSGLDPKLPVINESGQYIHHPASAHYHARQHSDHSYLDMSPMHHPPLPPPPVHPDMMNPIPYYPGYQGTNLTPGGGTGTSTKYCDLNSFAQMNPITYWEQQQRLRPTVDDGLNFLMEPYTKFEDVSTTPSVVESTIIDGDDESIFNGGGVHEYGGTRRPITSRGVHDYPTYSTRGSTTSSSPYVNIPTRLSKIPRSRRNSERDSLKDEPIMNDGVASSQDEDLTGTQEDNGTGYPITHFPSADCCTPTFLTRHHEDVSNGSGMLDSTSTLAAPADLSED